MQPVENRWTKKRKAEEEAAIVPPANVVMQFQSDDGVKAGPQLSVQQDVTIKQLNLLLNQLLSNNEALPYSFFIEEQELASNLGEHLQKNKVSVETALCIVYQPQAIFRVRPVSRCTASMPGHAEAVLAVSFSPDGRHLASGSGDTTVRFWDLSTQLPEHTCQGHKNWVQIVSWSPDAAMLASGDQNGVIWLWQPKTGETIGACRGHTKCIMSMAWEPAHIQMPCKRFVSASQDGTAKVWDANTRRCVFTLSGHTRPVTCVKWGGDGFIHTSSRDGSIMVWDAKTGARAQTLQGHGHWVNTLALSAEYALRTGPFDHTGTAPSDPAEAKEAALRRYQTACGSSPERLVSGSDDFTMFLWQPSVSKKPLQRMTGHMQLINQVQFSPDGRWIVSASFDKAVKLWDGVKGTFITTFRGHVRPVYQVSWSSDSRLVVSASSDSTLKVWNIHSKKNERDLPGHADEVFSVDWSPDGGSIASGGKDQVLKLWRH
ncbi:hypothetical protein ABBQ32_005511 [Trebouxia sp. C0010 RCD-2024]